MCGIAGIFDLKGKRNIDKKLAEDLIGVLKHRGPDDDGYWNEEGASVNVRILPPWWLTWWMKGIYMLIGIAIVIIIAARLPYPPATTALTHLPLAATASPPTH